MVDGQKMSKSLGNFYTLRDILDKGFTGREIRWVLIGAHYRQSLNFSFKELENARTALQRIDALIQRLKEVQSLPDAGVEALAPITAPIEAKFADSLADDLNISGALAALFDYVRELNKLMDANSIGGAAAKKALDTIAHFDEVLALCQPDATDDVPAEIVELAEQRQQARKAKDFAKADAIRNQLDAQGWVVEDTPKGPRIKRK